jgi:hypothetical protein
MELAARQWVRAIRGRRSQVAMSRWLGYRGNVVAKWEGGQRFPAFGELLRACERVGIDVGAALARFHAASAPSWSKEAPLEVSAWLRALLGTTPQTLVAEKSGLSRQQVGRLVSGRSQGHAPEVMSLVDGITGRLPDLIAELVPIEQVPALAQAASVRRALARLAFEHPWSSAAQAWLGVRGDVPARDAAARLSADLGLDEAHGVEVLAALVDAGAVVREGGSLRPAASSTVEVNATPADMRRLRAHWAAVAAARMARADGDDLFSFNVFAASRDDVEKIRLAQRRFYREVRAIVADSEPEVVMLLTAHTAVLA